MADGTPALCVRAPMLARLARTLPEGDQWVFEPKFDGFRCIVLRRGVDLELVSRNGRPLARYFPEVVAGIAALSVGDAVLDGEVVIERDGRYEFAPLMQRLHPAASRVARL